MKTNQQPRPARPIVELNINFDQAERNGLNIRINYLEDELTGEPTDMPNSLSFTLTGENNLPLPTLNNNQCRRLYEDFGLSEDNIALLDDKVTNLMNTAIIKQRLDNCFLK